MLLVVVPTLNVSASTDREGLPVVFGEHWYEDENETRYALVEWRLEDAQGRVIRHIRPGDITHINQRTGERRTTSGTAPIEVEIGGHRHYLVRITAFAQDFLGLTVRWDGNLQAALIQDPATRLTMAIYGNNASYFVYYEGAWQDRVTRTASVAARNQNGAMFADMNAILQTFGITHHINETDEVVVRKSVDTAHYRSVFFRENRSTRVLEIFNDHPGRASFTSRQYDRNAAFRLDNVRYEGAYSIRLGRNDQLIVPPNSFAVLRNNNGRIDGGRVLADGWSVWEGRTIMRARLSGSSTVDVWIYVMGEPQLVPGPNDWKYIWELSDGSPQGITPELPGNNVVREFWELYDDYRRANLAWTEEGGNVYVVSGIPRNITIDFNASQFSIVSVNNPPFEFLRSDRIRTTRDNATIRFRLVSSINRRIDAFDLFEEYRRAGWAWTRENGEVYVITNVPRDTQITFDPARLSVDSSTNIEWMSSREIRITRDGTEVRFRIVPQNAGRIDVFTLFEDYQRRGLARYEGNNNEMMFIWGIPQGTIIQYDMTKLTIDSTFSEWFDPTWDNSLGILTSRVEGARLRFIRVNP
ncbi:hypothetical protein FWH09_03035 [Candidatus Saccharibacteria bacterium]|nr:hypothetical protein [Candidatus Saccharibacteria bacterium]